MTTVTLFGANGRMGRAGVSALINENDIALKHLVDIAEFSGVELAPGYNIEEDSLSDNLLIEDNTVPFEADVWVDVSLTEPAFNHALIAEKYGIPILIGATGFSAEQSERLNKLKNAHLIAPNLSPGVNLLFDLIPKIMNYLGDSWDISIHETHHRHKKDAPSGTAKRFAELIQKEGRPVQVTSDRLGEIIGEHTVRFTAAGEEFTLSHRAFSRLAFASGIAPAVRFLAGKTEGGYTMIEALEFQNN